MSFDSLSIHSNLGLGLAVALFLALAAYTWYVYRYTVPEIPRVKRIVLNTLRLLVLFMIVFLTAEPVITLVTKQIVYAKHAVFIDRSASVTHGVQGEANKKFIQNFLSQTFPENTEFFWFDGSVQKVARDSISIESMLGSSTAFSPIFAEVKKQQDLPASITILSDGIVNTGTDPTFTAERSGVPVYSIVVGDSTKRRDLIIQGIEVPEAMIAGTQYILRAQFTLQGMSNPSIRLRFKEEGEILEEKSLVVGNGFHTVSVAYTPKTAGEKKLYVEIDSVNSESNRRNNNAIRFAQVKDSKIKVLLIAGSPSADFTFMKNALEADTNIIVRSIVEVGKNKFLNTFNEKILDSCTVYFLVGYPALSSSPQLFQQVLTRIREKQKSFFLLLDDSYAQNMVQELSDYLPAKVKWMSSGSMQVQPLLTANGQRHPVIKNAGLTTMWDDLPPVARPNVELQVKAESEVLLSSKVGNANLPLPLMVSKAMGNQRSVLLAAKDIWRWQLNAKERTAFFTSLWQNNFKWIRAGGDRERLSVRSDKKLYSLGEKVVLHAELFDESYNLLSGEQISISVRKGQEVTTPVFTQIGTGLYECSFEPSSSGDYTYMATYAEAGKKPIQKSGRFTVSAQNLELVNLEADYSFLAYLSKVSNGKAFYQSYSGYFQELQKLTARSMQEKKEVHEFVLRDNYWVLVLLIMLFSIEWFIRKRAGMI